jgi:hypothetical protein
MCPHLTRMKIFPYFLLLSSIDTKLRRSSGAVCCFISSDCHVQSECSILEGEAAVAALQAADADVIAPADPYERSRDPTTGLCIVASSVEQLRAVAQGAFVAAMRKALDSGHEWAAVNGAVHCWNTCLPAMRNGWCDHLVLTCPPYLSMSRAAAV